MTPDQLGIVGPGKPLYEQYRNLWATYKHPLPAWSDLGWEALAIWNALAHTKSK